MDGGGGAERAGAGVRGAGKLQRVAKSMSRGTEHMPEVGRFNWPHRLYVLPVATPAQMGA
jgi:hypothetical protein